MTLTTRSILGGTTALFLAATVSATPIVIAGTEYVRAGNSETGLTASFGPSGTAVSTPTSLAYTGFVEIVISGVGFSNGSCSNDAFYVFSGCGAPPPYNDPSYYQLALDTDPITGAPGTPTPFAQLAKNAIVFDVDAATGTTPLYVPAYRPDHTYNFVVDLSKTGGGNGPSLLYFGVADGVYDDNGGAYKVDVYQLDAVPEPGSLLLLGSGIAALAARRRRRA